MTTKSACLPTSQLQFDEETDYRLYYALRGYPKVNMRNVVRAMHSLKRVTELWMTTAAAHVHHPRGKKGALREAAVTSGWYSHIIYARPDLRYVTPLDVTLLRGLSDEQLYTPSWACWQGGYNDRFAAGRPTAAAAFGMRLDLAPRVAQLPKTHPWRWAIDLPKSGWGLHSESFVRTALEDARVKPVFSASPCGHRVRVRGTESVTDCINLTAWQPGRHQCLPLRDLKFPPGV